VGGVVVPDGEAPRAAEALAHETLSPSMFNNGVRTFIFGALVAQGAGIEHDAEASYIAALLHNLGLAAPYADDRRFEVSGADGARAKALARGFSEDRAQKVWDAVALHTQIGIASAKGGEVALVHLGASADVVGLGLDELPAERVSQTLAEYPRLRFKQEISEALVSAARRNPDAYVLTFLADALRDLNIAPLPTFERLLFSAPFDE
jgi:hypothetical protein